MMYQLTSDPSTIFETTSSSMIHAVTSPQAWAEYQTWLSEGNIPLPFPGNIPRPLADVKQERIDQINERCEAEIIGGFSSSALGLPHRYDSQIEDQINLIGAVIAATGGATIDYNCYDDQNIKSWKTHSPAQMMQVYQDGLVFKVTQLRTASTLKQLIRDAATQEEVEAIQWQ